MNRSSCHTNHCYCFCDCWTTINAICLSASILLFAFIGLCADEHRAKILAKKVYLFYNVMTTFVWCSEAWSRSFPKKNYASQTTKQNIHTQRRWMMYTELAFAIYFLGDSIKVLVDWRYRQETLTLMKIDLLLNMIGYIYFLVFGYDKDDGYEELGSLESSI